ncbi:hypothetical protein R1T08_06760 [Streptomyces sp. SBC-4]|nr:hypothetical protein [Streptomyces sp. SBC-4]MDV5143974.1 hypothetical protein [Streptomyces sp. SBC-4]
MRWHLNCARVLAVVAVTAIAPVFATQAQAVDGTLPADTSIRYELFGNYLIVTAAPGVDNQIVIHGGDAFGVVRVYDFADNVTQPDTFSTEGPNGVRRIAVYAGDGNDKVSHFTGLRGALHGGGGDDILNGSNHADFLNGESGNDRLNGGGGRDDLNGGDGDDHLDGGGDVDSALGGTGNDTCTSCESAEQCE